MVYLDTSALVPLFILEPKSEALLGWIASCREPMAVSEWGLVEFASATSIKVRTGQTSAHTARQAGVRLEAFVRQHCQVVLPDRTAFHRAAELARNPQPALRAGDALHLAIAQSLNAGSLLCLDDAMVAVARSLGLQVPEF
jgi:predicted nucleic acid-binding protein